MVAGLVIDCRTLVGPDQQDGPACAPLKASLSIVDCGLRPELRM
jgi:hypothetical protein